MEKNRGLNQIVLLARSEIQVHTLVVVIDDRGQCRESAVMIEAAFQVRENGPDRRGAVALVRRPVGLK